MLADQFAQPQLAEAGEGGGGRLGDPLEGGRPATEFRVGETAFARFGLGEDGLDHRPDDRNVAGGKVDGGSRGTPTLGNNCAPRRRASTAAAVAAMSAR